MGLYYRDNITSGVIGLLYTKYDSRQPAVVEEVSVDWDK